MKLVNIDSIPKRMEWENYYLEPITTEVAVEDWLTILDNAGTIEKQRGGGCYEGWPYNFSLEDNYKDLAWLERSAEYERLFCYVIRDLDSGKYLGCLYIYPIDLFYPELSDKYVVDFTFWIVEELYEKGQYEKIFKRLVAWLVEDWKFKRDKIYLRNAEVPESLQS